jgi:hypothetical protein
MNFCLNSGASPGEIPGGSGWGAPSDPKPYQYALGNAGLTRGIDGLERSAGPPKETGISVLSLRFQLAF